MPDSRTVVLLSGGVDSSLCLLRAHREGRLHSALQVNYEQPMADAERRAAQALCDSLGVQRVPLRAYHPGRAAMWAGHGATGPRVVPGRNLWLISLAVSHAAACGATSVTIGCNADDAANYPDCRPQFIEAAHELAARAYGIAVLAPLVGLSKQEVIAEWVGSGRSLDECWSCYESKNLTPCGTCDACVLRRSAMVGG
jgi:7-cyano-7-deazaguanine synthase